MHTLALTTSLSLLQYAAAQQIWDFWQTSWSRVPLFEYNPSTTPAVPVNFGSVGTIGQADIVVDDSTVYQTMYGFGGSLTDASALELNNLKSQNSANYNTLLSYMFDITDGANAAGLSYVRVPLGASDFSATTYSYDDTSGDTSLSDFSISKAPSYVFTVLQDILKVNPSVRVHLLPWSPPGWMKNGSHTMDGGSLESQYETDYANYLLKCLQGFESKSIPIFAIGIQNEPQNNNPTYPTALMDPGQEGMIATTLRGLMNSNGFSSTKIVGYEHNWDDAGAYPVTLMQDAGSVFDGVAFHCYAGDVSDQSEFTAKYPSKEVFFTECTGTIGTDWWSDIKWYMDNIFIGSVNYGSSSGLMWNIAGNTAGGPLLPGTTSCGGGGCRPIVTINGDGTYTLNQEFYSMAQAAKAIIPKDAGGPWGQRIGVTIGGTLNWALVVSAFVTKRLSSTDWWRYSLVVLNWDDNASTTWDPISVETTIEFQDAQATITFPVGVTTLWWYAAPPSLNGTENGSEEYASPDDGTEIFGGMEDGNQVPLGVWRKEHY